MSGPSGDAELAAVLALVRRWRPAAVALGHGRAPADEARAAAFRAAWTEGEVVAVVSWPERAASWLRQANRLATAGADVWVVADGPAGWAGIGPRLVAAGGWRADRTVAFSGLADPGLPDRAGRAATDGLVGATADGGRWSITDGELRTGAAVPRWS